MFCFKSQLSEGIASKRPAILTEAQLEEVAPFVMQPNLVLESDISAADSLGECSSEAAMSDTDSSADSECNSEDLDVSVFIAYASRLVSGIRAHLEYFVCFLSVGIM